MCQWQVPEGTLHEMRKHIDALMEMQGQEAACGAHLLQRAWGEAWRRWECAAVCTSALAGREAGGRRLLVDLRIITASEVQNLKVECQILFFINYFKFPLYSLMASCIGNDNVDNNHIARRARLQRRPPETAAPRLAGRQHLEWVVSKVGRQLLAELR